MNERLEEILNDLPYSIRHSGELEDLKEYSRSLAERVGELEENKHWLIKDVLLWFDKFNDEKQQNKRYRETIKEIKNEAEWMIELSEHGHKFESIKNRCDEALEGDKE